MFDPSQQDGQYELVTLHDQTRRLRAQNLKYLSKTVLRDVLTSEGASTYQENAPLFYQSGNITSFQGTLLKLKSQVFRRLFNVSVLGPEQRILILWNFFFLSQLIVQMFYIPYYLAVKLIAHKLSWTNLIINQSLPIACYFLDILLTLNTQIYKKGQIYDSRKQIAYEYVKGSFILDVIIVTSQILAAFSEFQTDILLILKFFRLYQVLGRLEARLSLKERFRWFVVTKLVLNLFYVIHYCGCAFLIIGIFEHQADMKSWIDTYKMDFSDINYLYVYSIYWSTITLLTVGYGDITPQTSVERIYCILISMVTIGVVGYVINSIGQSLKDMNEKEEYKNTRMALLDIFLQKNKIPQTLCLRIKDYYYHYYSNLFKSDSKDNDVTENLEPKLKRELNLYLNKKILEKSRYLGEYISDDCLEELCQVVKQESYIPGKTIFDKNQQTQCLAFLMSGSISICNVFSDFNNQYRQRFTHKGQVINEISFLRQEDRPFDSIAITKTQISYLTYEDFIKVLRKFPDDYERYNFYKQSDQNSKEFRELKFCELCTQPHQAMRCSQLFYTPNRTTVILDYISPQLNDRKTFYRKQRSKHEPIEIQNAALQRLLEDQDFDQLNDPNYLEKLGFLDISNIQDQSKAIQQNQLPEIVQRSSESESEQSSGKEEKVQKVLTKDNKSLFSYKRIETIQQVNKQFESMNSKSSVGRGNNQKNSFLIIDHKQSFLKARRSMLSDQINLRRGSKYKEERFSVVSIKPSVINKIPVFPSQLSRNQQQLDLANGRNIDNYFQQRQEIERSKFYENSKVSQQGVQQSSMEILVQTNKFGETLQDLDIHQTYLIFFPNFNIQRILQALVDRKTSQLNDSIRNKIMTKFQKRQNGINNSKHKNSPQLKDDQQFKL